jgi:hypothetical protein
MKFKTLFNFTLIITAACSMNENKISEFNVDASQIIHKMKGGMGASWHAITDVLPLNNENYNCRQT